jgi:hypothetical protein
MPVDSASHIIAAMSDAAPRGLSRLDETTLGRLRALTRSLQAASPAAGDEYARFLAIGDRELTLPPGAVSSWLAGQKVLVTGGTGCVGSVLMRLLAAARPARLVSVSRGITAGWPRQPAAEYTRADVRDLPGLAGAIASVQPDVLFHLAAQRDPGLAEREVHRTVTTNVLGTRNVIAAAERCGVPLVVYASTGKALRPYTPDTYAASKRAAEWLLAAAAARGGGYCAARFTHVVDNSIIHRKLQEWAGGGVLRLHAADIMFYAQSALESAQLLLSAGLAAAPGSFLVQAITDLGWPVCLLDLALGVLTRTGAAAAIYFSGYDPGYEDVPFPGLYDPRTASGVSPLLSAFEAVRAQQAPGAAADVFPLAFAPDPEPDKLLLALEETCELTQEPGAIRAALDALTWSLLTATLRTAPADVLARAAARTAPHRDRLNRASLRMLAAIEDHALGTS